MLEAALPEPISWGSVGRSLTTMTQIPYQWLTAVWFTELADCQEEEKSAGEAHLTFSLKPSRKESVNFSTGGNFAKGISHQYERLIALSATRSPRGNTAAASPSVHARAWNVSLRGLYAGISFLRCGSAIRVTSLTVFSPARDRLTTEISPGAGCHCRENSVDKGQDKTWRKFSDRNEEEPSKFSLCCRRGIQESGK